MEIGSIAYMYMNINTTYTLMPYQLQLLCIVHDCIISFLVY